MKDSNGNVPQLVNFQRVMADNFNLMVGTVSIWYPALVLGTDQRTHEATELNGFAFIRSGERLVEKAGSYAILALILILHPGKQHSGVEL